MGDCIMVLYGAPISQEDQVIRAARSAVDMRERLSRLNEKFAHLGLPEFQIGIGINAGDVTVGHIGGKDKREYTVIGDAVNVAFRLQGIAEPGEILISERAYRDVEAFVKAEEREPVLLKGKEVPVRVYSLISLEE